MVIEIAKNKENPPKNNVHQLHGNVKMRKPQERPYNIQVHIK